MAKSGQRRAYVDETVQDTLPGEELRVGDRGAVNIGASIDAEYNRSGLYFNPQFFRDLAEVSDDIHKTRRFSNAMKERVALQDATYQQEEDYRVKERNIQKTQNAELIDYKLSFSADVEDTKERAKRNGQSVQTAIDNLIPKYSKLADNLYNRSAYIGDNFRKYTDEYFIRASKEGLAIDAATAEYKQRYAYDKTFALGINNIINAGWDFDRYLQSLPDTLFPGIDKISDDAENSIINKGYNMGFIADIKRYAAMVKTGQATPQEVKAYIAAGLAEYGDYTLTGKNEKGEDVSVKCFLEPETISVAQQLLSKLDEDRNKANAVYTAEAYKQMVGYDNAKKGEFDKIYYYNSTTLSKAREDYNNARRQLVLDAGSGNENAVKQLYEIDNHYFTVVQPQIAFRDILRKSLAEHGNMDSALRDIRARLIKVKGRLLNGDSLENVTDLSWVDKDGVMYMNLAFPESGVDPVYDDFLRRSGVTGYNARYNYYQALVDAGENFLDKAQTSDLLVAMDSNYAMSMEEVSNTLTYQHLVREDAQTGTIAVNQSALGEAAQLISKSQVAAKSAAGDTIVNSASASLLSDIAKQGSNLNVKQKAFYYQAIAKSFLEAGVSDPFVFYKNAKMTDAEKEAQKQIAMWAFISKTPEYKDLENKIMTNLVGGEYPNPSLQTANALLKNKMANAKEATLSNEIQRKFNEHNIPAEFQPALRYMFTQAAVASIAGDDSKKNLTFDTKIMDKILDANFTKNGTYRYAAALKNTPAEEVDKRIESSLKMIEEGAKKLGFDKEITAKLDYETGLIRFYANGQPINGTGSYKPLQGSGVVPFTIDADAKPAGMPQSKYNDAQTALLASTTMLMGLSNIETSPTVQGYVKKYGGGITNDQVKQLAYKYMNEINDPEVQRGWYAYYNSNYENTKVQAAPTEFKRVMLDSMRELHISLGGTFATFNAPSQDQMNHFIDYVYTRMQNGKSVRIDVPKSTYFESNGFPYNSVDAQVRSAGYGWKITSATEGKHATNSLHYRGYAVDLGFEGGWNSIFNSVGMLDTRKLDALVNNTLNVWNKEGIIKGVYTSNPELLKGQGKNPLYAKYRNMKLADGTPMFKYYADHWDHFHVEFNRQVVDPKTNKALGGDRNKLVREMSNVLYTNMNSKGSFGFLNRNECKSLVTLYWNYKPTQWDVEATGRSYKELTSSPIARATAAAVKYSRAKNALGSADKAVAGLQGAKFKLVLVNPGSKSVKQPDKLFTLEEALDLSAKGIGSGDLRGQFVWQIADTGNMQRYNDTINRFIRAGR